MTFENFDPYKQYGSPNWATADMLELAKSQLRDVCTANGGGDCGVQAWMQAAKEHLQALAFLEGLLKEDPLTADLLLVAKAGRYLEHSSIRFHPKPRRQLAAWVDAAGWRRRRNAEWLLQAWPPGCDAPRNAKEAIEQIRQMLADCESS